MAASYPKDGSKRFAVVLEGVEPKAVIGVWSDLCQAGKIPSVAFKAIYPFLTTIQGTRFRFRGGDPDHVKANLEQLFGEKFGKGKIKTHVESV